MSFQTTPFSEKLLKGKCPSEEEWVDYLEYVHTNKPNLTPKMFTSTLYQALAKSIRENERVLDLACGAGSLIDYSPQVKSWIGIDMTEREIELAKSRYGHLPQVTFKKEKAQRLSLLDKSVDTVVCNLSLQLMTSVNEVIGEVHRVLKDGGIFAITLPQTLPNTVDPLLEEESRRSLALSATLPQTEPSKEQKEAEQHFQTSLKRHLPQFARVPLGDLFGASEEEIRASLACFDRVSIEPLTLTMEKNIDELWSFYANRYLFYILPQTEQQHLEQKIKATYAKQINKGELVPLKVTLLLVRAFK